MNGPLLTVLVRQWRVTVPILLLAIVAAVFVANSGTDVYRSDGTILLARPELDPARLPENVIDVVGTTERLAESDLAAELRGGGGRLTAVAHDRTTVEVTVEGDSAGAAETALLGAIEWLEEDAARSQEQASVPEPERLDWLLLTPDTRAARGDDGGYRAAATLWIEGLSGSEENPYSTFGGLTRIVEVTMNSPERREIVAQRIGHDVGFSLRRTESRSLPILALGTSGLDPDRVLAGFDGVVEEISALLSERQARANVPVTRRMYVEVVAAPIEATPVDPGRPMLPYVILLLGVAVAGGVATLRERRPGPTSGGGPATPAGLAAERHAPANTGHDERHAASSRT